MGYSAGRAVPCLVAGGAVYCMLCVDLSAAGGAFGASCHTGPAGGDVVGLVCGGPAWGGAVAAHTAGLCRACGHAGRAGLAHLGRQLEAAQLRSGGNRVVGGWRNCCGSAWPRIRLELRGPPCAYRESDNLLSCRLPVAGHSCGESGNYRHLAFSPASVTWILTHATRGKSASHVQDACCLWNRRRLA